MMDELIEEMIDPAPSREDLARRHRAWATGAILVLAGVGATSLTTAAVFTDADPLTGALSTGTLVLEAGGAELTMPVGGLAPGGTVVAPLTVRNTGSLELRYALSMSAASTSAAGADLRDQLRLRVLEDATCTLDSVTSARELGRVPAADGAFGLPGEQVAVVGDPATGAQSGDRTLVAVTGAETLCLEVHMARDAGNDYQDTSVALSLVLDSEQTVNN